MIVDESEIYASGITEFHWVLTHDYGYLPIDTAGRIVSGLTDGFTPWLVDDESQGVEPPCCQPGPQSPPPTPRVIVTPEPGTLLMVGAGLVGFMRSKSVHRRIRALARCSTAGTRCMFRARVLAENVGFGCGDPRRIGANVGRQRPPQDGRG
jgi:hypothetical protein